MIKKLVCFLCLTVYTIGQIEVYRHIRRIRGSTTMRSINQLTYTYLIY